MLGDKKIEILCTESLGVRGLSCLIQISVRRRVIIDPCLAQGFTCYGLYPLQAIIGGKIKMRFNKGGVKLQINIITYFHKDHTALYNANLFQHHTNIYATKNT